MAGGGVDWLWSWLGGMQLGMGRGCANPSLHSLIASVGGLRGARVSLPRYLGRQTGHDKSPNSPDPVPLALLLSFVLMVGRGVGRLVG